jgi:hypothetical protein
MLVVLPELPVELCEFASSTPLLTTELLSKTVILTVAFVEPDPLLAVTVYAVFAMDVVGVPEMTPVDVLKVRPVSVFKFGLMAYDVGVPPDVDGVLLVIAVPLT